MDQTFITIHDLSPDANILFASESITDILGYHPLEVQNTSCFDYFHHEEVSFARFVHSRCVLLDKAAVLHYARLRSQDGRWVTCECCFTIVYDVLVASAGVYRRGEKSERRAIAAPQISRTFSCSPDDPRHQFLEYLSFTMGGAGDVQVEREPRAALILNRFTRSLDIMFATNAVTSILGLTADQIRNRNFYEFIQESCLDDAVSRLENAKAKDSIAYMRFWSRDHRPRGDLDEEEEGAESDDRGGDGDGEDKDEDECEKDYSRPNEDPSVGKSKNHRGDSVNHDILGNSGKQKAPQYPVDIHTKLQGVYGHMAATDTGNSPSFPCTSFDADVARETGSLSDRRSGPSPKSYRDDWRRNPVPPVELEAVVSCTSDGLVVVLRKARSQTQIPHHHAHPIGHDDAPFAGSWGRVPARPCCQQELPCMHRQPPQSQFVSLHPSSTHFDQLMRSIRDVAVFAQALVGISRNVTSQSLGPVAETAHPSRESCCCGSHAGPSQGPSSENYDVLTGDMTAGMAEFPMRTRGNGRTALSGQEADNCPREQ